MKDKKNPIEKWQPNVVEFSKKFHRVWCPVCSQVFPVTKDVIPNHYYPYGEDDEIVCVGSNEAAEHSVHLTALQLGLLAGWVAGIVIGLAARLIFGGR